MYVRFFVVCSYLCFFIILINAFKNCSIESNITHDSLTCLSKAVIPPLEGLRKGDAGKIMIIGGSIEYTGAPYFSAISSLKVGADLVYVATTEEAAPIIKSYSPDLIVYPYLTPNTAAKINTLITKMDVIVIGPGLGREDNTMKLFYNIIDYCRKDNKPLVIDADGLYAISKNVSVIKDYPKPGVILTPNFREASHLMQATTNSSKWTDYWGPYISVLVKGQNDQFFSSIPSFNWIISEGGTGRRVGGQGDILAGTLGTFYKWALTNLQHKENFVSLGQSVACYAAAKFTRSCNVAAFTSLGRSMLASDMIKEFKSELDMLFLES